MKKLNGTELGALAEKILLENSTKSDKTLELLESEVKNEMNKLWSKFKKSNDYKVLQKYGLITNVDMSKIIPDIKRDGFTFSTKYLSNYYKSIKSDFGTIYTKGWVNTPSWEEIKRELILGQIDATDIESLVYKVKSSLKLK